MKKSLSERIAVRTTAMGTNKTSLSAQHRAIFLAQRQEIVEALEDGWTVKTIWETLNDEGKITFSYQTFRRYVNKLILEKKLAKPKNMAALENPESAIILPTKSTKPESIAGFQFRPSPKKEELI